jgi:hypothetical protein
VQGCLQGRLLPRSLSLDAPRPPGFIHAVVKQNSYYINRPNDEVYRDGFLDDGFHFPHLHKSNLRLLERELGFIVLIMWNWNRTPLSAEAGQPYNLSHWFVPYHRGTKPD